MIDSGLRDGNTMEDALAQAERSAGRNVSAALAKTDLILASGLVQNEAAIRKDEREKCAAQCEDIYSWRGAYASGLGLLCSKTLKTWAAAIRSARDGGAES